MIDKPKGLVVHPAAGHAKGTLVNALIAHCGDSLSGIGGVKRPGIVHRLDKDTTGLMVVAKTDAAHRALSAQFANKAESGIERGYLALVWGAPSRPKGTIDAPLDRHPRSSDKRAVREGGRAGGDPLASAGALHRRRRQAGREPAWPARWRPAAPTRSGCIWPISATRSWATPPTAPASRPRPACFPPPPAPPWKPLADRRCMLICLRFEHPGSGEILEFRSELPADLRRLRDALTARSP